MDLADRVQELEWQGQVMRQRIATLRRQNRLLALVAVLSAGLGGAALWSIRIQPSAASVVLDGLTVRDRDGSERILLATPADSTATSIDLYDKERQHLARLEVERHGLGLSLRSAGERGPRATLTAHARGPAIELEDTRWQARLAFEPEGPALLLAERQEEHWRPRAVLALSTSGPSLKFLDRQGNVTQELPGRGASPSPILTAETVRTKGVTLVDDQGATRGELVLRKGTPLLSLRGADGRPAIELTAGPEGPRAVLFNRAGEPGVVIEQGLDRPTVALADNKGKRRAELSVVDQTPRLALHDGEGRLRTALAVAPDGRGTQLRFFDPEGRRRAAIGIGETGSAAQFEFFDIGGNLRASLGVEGETSFFGLSGSDGKPRAVIGADDEAATIQLLSRAQKQLVTLAANEQSGAEVSLCDAEGRPRAVLSATLDGANSMLSFLDGRRTLRALLGVNDNKPTVAVRDEVGQNLFTIPETKP